MKLKLIFPLLLLLFFLACSEEHETFSYGKSCQKYVDTYLLFHSSVLNSNFTSDQLVDLFYIHHEDNNNIANLKKLTREYIKHEMEISEISEFSARCNSIKDISTIKFKIEDIDNRINRLYVVISKGKIRTLSKEIVEPGDAYFDNNEVYIPICSCPN